MMDIDKAKDKAAKLKAHMESARTIGSTDEAEAFAAALNRLLLQYELSMDEVAYAAKPEDPIITVMVDEEAFGVTHKQKRVAWREQLAHVVGRANMCQELVARARSSRVWFCGTKQHAEVASYLFAVLARTAENLCEMEYRRFYHKMRHTCKWCGVKRADHTGLLCYNGFESNFAATHNYRESWLAGFIAQIAKRFDAERKAEASTSTALIRIDNALQRAKDHVANLKKASHLSGLSLDNQKAFQHGADAAKEISLKANAMRAGEQVKKIR